MADLEQLERQVREHLLDLEFVDSEVEGLLNLGWSCEGGHAAWLQWLSTASFEDCFPILFEYGYYDLPPNDVDTYDDTEGEDNDDEYDY